MKRNLLILFSTFVFISCQNQEEQLSFETRKFINNNFIGNEFTKSRDSKHFVIFYKLDSCQLSFLINVERENYIIENQNSFGECNFLGKGLKDSLSNDASIKTKYLDSLNVVGLTSEFKKEGVLFKIYMRDGSAYILVGDISKIVNNNWKAYINKSKALGEGWYYISEDY